MTFTIKNIITKNVKGTFQLLPQSTGRVHNESIIANEAHIEKSRMSRENSAMCDSQSSEAEAATVASALGGVDDFDPDLRKSMNSKILSEQQKVANDHLFLRYLELDPTEGPDALPAALQRKATGNKNGRTPFTQTKKLVRQPKTGFGFSVVWTHPPRIERVEKNMPADKAGILPGDYIIFVDKQNVVTMPEIEILNLIRSLGNQLTLEIFRRNATRNGSVPSVKRVGVAESSAGLPSASLSTQRRPSTACSTTNTASADYNRKKLHLPQIAFTSEVGAGVLV